MSTKEHEEVGRTKGAEANRDAADELASVNAWTGPSAPFLSEISLQSLSIKRQLFAWQTLTATNADRKNPKKLEVTPTPTSFTLPLLPSGEWLILRFKENAQAKTITARFEYDTTNCAGCNQMEWLCACKKEE